MAKGSSSYDSVSSKKPGGAKSRANSTYSSGCTCPSPFTSESRSDARHRSGSTGFRTRTIEALVAVTSRKRRSLVIIWNVGLRKRITFERSVLDVSAIRLNVNLRLESFSKKSQHLETPAK